METAKSTLQTRILIIDDEESFRTLMVRLLIQHGFRTLEAKDGQEGIQLAQAEIPDLVLCDLEMPNMNGYQVLEALQAETRVAAIPVIFLTGLSAPAQVRYGMNLGADDYLTKPVDPGDLVNAIRTRLARVRRLRTPSDASQPVPSRLGEQDTILIKTATEQRLVRVGQVTHILAYGEYSWVYCEKSRGALLRKSLKQWAVELPAQQFVRVHRSAIVNLAYLDRVERLAGRMHVRLRDTAEPILVSVRLAPALNRKLRRARPGKPSPITTPSFS